MDWHGSTNTFALTRLPPGALAQPRSRGRDQAAVDDEVRTGDIGRTIAG